MKSIKLLFALLAFATQIEAAQLAAAMRSVRTRAVQMHVMRHRAMSNKPLRPDMAKLKDGTIIDLTKNYQSQESRTRIKDSFKELEESFVSLQKTIDKAFLVIGASAVFGSILGNVLGTVIGTELALRDIKKNGFGLTEKID